jgi:aldose 1-epimerase
MLLVAFMKSPLPFLFSLVLFTGLPQSARAETLPARAVAAQTADGQPVEVFTLTNAHGLRARVITWGATLVEMSVPDRAGKLADVTLGFDAIERYLQPHPQFGNVVGRYANRIGGAKFSLEGKEVKLATNSGRNHIHGGPTGFAKRHWKAEPAGPRAVRLSYTSADGEEGYPGKLTVAVTYTLTEKDELRLDYEATTDAPTVVNLSNHTYWNLAGRGDVLGHELRLNASRFTAVDRELIPTGTLAPVAGTPLDFTKAKPVGRDLEAAKAADGFGGYDHNYVIDAPKPGDLTLAAEVHDPESGRTMRCLTTEPGVQLYTANHLKDLAGRNGAVYGPHAGLCLETQHFPDSPNHPEFPSTTLRPGETFRSTTIYEFSVQ